MTVFQVATSRGGDIARQLLGEFFNGLLVVDRWPAYRWVKRRQLCWSHLSRDMQGFVDRGGVGCQLGEKLLVQVHVMFHLWHRVRDKTLQRRTFQRRMKSVEQRILRLLRRAQLRAEPKTAGMAREILAQADCLFVFVDTEGVEPTNSLFNFADRP